MGRASETYERLTAELLERNPRRGWNDFICPRHDDNKPSLGVTLRNGKVLIHCSAGCKPEDVLKALGLKMSDLFDRGNGSKPAKTPAKRVLPLPSEPRIERIAQAL